uniref:Uncharacterized protein n=1 Tax=Triticum urartu TaxID=4572 RepID=A0A8R7TDU1_TRIUA
MLQKSDESKHGRNVLKEQSRKMGTTQECLNKGRASAYSRFSIGCSSKIVDSVCKSNYRMELVKNSGFKQFCQVLHLVPSFFLQQTNKLSPQTQGLGPGNLPRVWGWWRGRGAQPWKRPTKKDEQRQTIERLGDKQSNDRTRTGAIGRLQTG